MAVGTVRGRFELDAPALRTLRDLERQGIRTQAQMKALGDEMDRLADKDDRRRIEQYRRDVSRIGRDTSKALIEAESAWNVQTKRINAHIDSTIARVELLHQRIQALGRERAVATVGTRTVGNPLGGVGGGGGTGSGINRVGGPGGGGGGGGRSGFRGVNIGGLSLGKGALLGGLGGVALPSLSAIGGLAGGLLGSAGAGALGLGATAFPAGLGAAAGFGSIFATAKPASAAIKEVTDAQKKLNAAIAEFGRRSKEARAARQELGLVMQMSGAAPGTLGLVRERQAFGEQYRRRTRPAAAQYIGLQRDLLGYGRRLTPAVASAGLTSTVAARQQANRFGRFASGGFGQRALGTGAEIFAENIPLAERSAENLLRTMLHLARAGRPFFREGMQWIREWTGGLDRSTRDIGETREQIGEMVDHLRSWTRLGGASVRLLKDLLGAGAPAGQSAVERLTFTLNAWDHWVRRNPRQTQAFFERSTQAAGSLAKAIWQIVRAVGRLSDRLLPVLSHFSELVAGAGALGLLTPGAGALAYGAYRGARGGMGGGGAAGGMGGAGVAAGVGAGMFAGRAAAGAAGAAGGARAGQLMYGQGFRSGAPQLVGSRAYGLSRLGGLGGVGGAALRGGGRAFLPAAAIMGVLDFAGFQGNVGQRFQAAASSATLGIVNRPQTGAELEDNVRRRVDQRVADLPRAPRRQREAIRRLRTQISSGGDTFIGTDANASQIAMGNKALRGELRHRLDIFRQYRQEIRSIRLERAQRDIQEAFRIRLGKQGPGRAIDALVDDTMKNLKGLGHRGQRQLAQNSIDWARQQARGNPRLLRHVKDLEERVVARFARMGRRVKIINGQIFDGSKREWGRIENALTSAAERARQEVEKSFTAIQRKAIGSLRAMGFSGSQARSLVAAEEGGGGGRKYARETIRLGQQGSAPSRQFQKSNARGGRIWGAGLGDNVSVGPGQKGAPGELIVNRHTEAGVDADLARAGKPPLSARVGRGRPHGYSAPGASKQTRGHTVPRSFMAVGGRIVPIPWQPGERTNSAILGLITRLHRGFGTNVSDSFGPGHQSPGHTQYGTAVDWVPGTTGWDGVDRLVKWAVSRGYKTLYDGRFGSTAWPDHGRGNHAHIEFGGGGARGGIPAGGGGMGAIHLRAPRSKLGGVPGALSNRASALYARGLQRHINRKIGGGGLGGFTGGGGAGANRRLAHRMMRAMGFPASEWGALNSLWTKESNFQTTIANQSSGAYGIPQALPGSKMATVGSDWRTNPATQIAWGLRYIRGRYGTPSAAWAHSQATNWYGRGGRIPAFRNGGSFVTGSPGLFMAGDNPYRRERVSVEPIRARRRPALARVGGVGGRHVSVNFNGPVSVRSDADIDKIADKVGKKVLAAISDDVSDEELGG